MATARIAELLREIFKATDEGRIHWTVRDDVVSFRGRAGSAEIRSKDQDQELPLVLELFGPGHRPIESIETESYTDDWGNPALTPESEQIVALYKKAREGPAVEILSALVEEVTPEPATPPAGYNPDEEPF